MPNSKDVLLGKWPVDQLTKWLVRMTVWKLSNSQDVKFEKWQVNNITGQNDCLKNDQFTNCLFW